MVVSYFVWKCSSPVEKIRMFQPCEDAQLLMPAFVFPAGEIGGAWFNQTFTKAQLWSCGRNTCLEVWVLSGCLQGAKSFSSNWGRKSPTIASTQEVIELMLCWFWGEIEADLPGEKCQSYFSLHAKDLYARNFPKHCLLQFRDKEQLCWKWV